MDMGEASSPAKEVSVPILLGLLLALAVPAADAENELVALDLPNTGALGSVALTTVQMLLGDAYDVWWLGQREPSNGQRGVSAVACLAGSGMENAIGSSLADYVKAGGGLVLVISGAADQIEISRKYLTPFKIVIQPFTNTESTVSFVHHPVTRAVYNLACPSLGVALAGENMTVLATEGGKAVMLAGDFGQGHLVVLPAEVLAGADPNKRPERARARLLAQAIKWAVGRAAPPRAAASVPPPQRASTKPVEVPPLPDDMSASALVDVFAQDAGWPELLATVSDATKQVGLTARSLPYKKDTFTLVQALARRPALVVIGSCREFSGEEGALLAEHVRNGGALLVLAQGAGDSVPRIMALNRLLGEFGITLTAGRPAGAVVLQPHPATAGVKGVISAPAGSSIWALGDWPLATVGGYAVVTAQEFGTGRIIVFDGAALLMPANAKSEAEDTSRGFRALLVSALKWVVGR